MGEIGFDKLLLILVVVLLLFGAKRLPEIGASFGKGIREFKRSLSDTQDGIVHRTDDPVGPSRQLGTTMQQARALDEPRRLAQ